jgi:hypothetical protein
MPTPQCAVLWSLDVCCVTIVARCTVLRFSATLNAQPMQRLRFIVLHVQLSAVSQFCLQQVMYPSLALTATYLQACYLSFAAVINGQQSMHVVSHTIYSYYVLCASNIVSTHDECSTAV